MPNTIHITLRLPAELVEEIDQQAKRESRSRSQMIVLRLGGNHGDVKGHERAARRTDGDEAKDQHGSRNRGTVPVLRDTKSHANDVHPVQPVRDELVQGSGCVQAPTHADHLTFVSGDKHWCSDCRVYY